jgi:hypothetical protein
MMSLGPLHLGNHAETPCRAAADAGITMKGICAADDPDQIQACLWRVDPASKDAPKEETKYQILF